MSRLCKTDEAISVRGRLCENEWSHCRASSVMATFTIVGVLIQCDRVLRTNLDTETENPVQTAAWRC